MCSDMPLSAELPACNLRTGGLHSRCTNASANLRRRISAASRPPHARHRRTLCRQEKSLDVRCGCHGRRRGCSRANWRPQGQLVVMKGPKVATRVSQIQGICKIRIPLDQISIATSLCTSPGISTYSNPQPFSRCAQQYCVGVATDKLSQQRRGQVAWLHGRHNALQFRAAPAPWWHTAC